ncbi:MAG: hypothetical protein VW708_09175, partial [Ilumatobacter sp.]
MRIKDLAVDLFGTNHRAALVIGMFLVIGVLGALAGRRHQRSPRSARAGIIVAGAMGLAAFLSRPDGRWWMGVISIVAALLITLA